MATTVPARPTTISFPERVVASADIVALLGAERIRELHAEIVRAHAAGQTLTIKIQPRFGKPVKVSTAAEREIR